MKKQSTSKRIVSVFLVLLMMLSSVPTGIFSLTAGAYIMPDPIDHLDEAFRENTRVDMDFDKCWKFYYGENEDGYKITLDHTDWQDVSLPHDFSITQNFTENGTEVESGCLPGGTGWYRKAFTLPTAFKDKQIILTFDGAYKDTTVYVNGTLVGVNHYGYNSFSFNITPYLKEGSESTINGEYVNLIAVKVTNDIPSSRWYSGSGITRDVTLTAVEPVHVSLYGTDVSTPNISGSSNQGTADAKITLQNDGNTAKTVKVKAKILDASGEEISGQKSDDIEKTTNVTLAAGAKQTVTLSPVASDISLWSVESPTLYTLRTSIYDGNTLVDQYDTSFGYRYVKWDVDTGFWLNGQNIKLKGVSMHHDQGALGAVQTYDAILRQVTKLKEMGCNAIRTTHNVPSQVLLQVCNEQGMLILEEFFDGWAASKNDNDYDFSQYCEVAIADSNNLLDVESGDKWYQFVTRQAVKRDRNNPCVVAWDSGNELTDPNNTTVAQGIQNIINDNDSYSFTAIGSTASGYGRPVTWGNDKGAFTYAADTYSTLYGGNYQSVNYYGSNRTSAGAKAKPFVGTETASAVSSRGVYKYTSSNTSNNAVAYASDSDHQINAYDASKVGWGNTAADAWYAVIANAWNSGEFVWTGFDYIGEPTPWNATTTNSSTTYPNSSYFGIIDTAGFEKDSFYLYRSLWREDSNTLHLVPGTWVRSELMGSKVPVVVYANGNNIKRVELYLNDSLIGSATADDTTVGCCTYYTWSITQGTQADDNFMTSANSHNLYPAFSVPYAAGTLTVKGYDASGNEVTDAVGTQSITSNVGNVATIESNVVTPSTPYADGDTYIYVEYTARDADGNFVNNYNGTIKVSLSGSTADCVIAGVDNGNAATVNKYQNSNVLIGSDVSSNVITNEDRQTANVEFFNGKALVIVRALNHVEPGIMRLAQVKSSSDPYVEGATVNIAADDIKDEFEEICPQGEIEYTTTTADTLDGYRQELKTEADGLGGDSSESVEIENLAEGYYQYNASTASVIPNGKYIIKLTSDNMVISDEKATYSTNVGLAKKTDGTVSDTTYTPSAASADHVVFNIEYSGNDNEYYITDKSGNYLTIGSADARLSLSSDKVTVNIYVNSSGNVLIYKIQNGTYYYVDYFRTSGGQIMSTWGSGKGEPTNIGENASNNIFTLYKYQPGYSKQYIKRTPATSGQVIPNGNYVIRGIVNSTYKIILNENTSSSGIAISDDEGTTTDNGNEILKVPSNVSAVYNVAKCNDGEANTYYITCTVNGVKWYLSVNDGGNNTTLTQVAKKSVLGVYGGKVYIKGYEYAKRYAGLTANGLSSGGADSISALASYPVYFFDFYQEKIYYEEEKGREIYNIYTPLTATESTHLVPDGDYALYGSGTYTYGYFSANYQYDSNNKKIFLTSQTTTAPTADKNRYVWHFEYVSGSGSSQQYYVTTSLYGGTGYLYFDSSNGMSLTSTATTVTVTSNSDGTVTIGGAGYYMCYYQNSSYGGQVVASSGSTSLTLYPVTRSATVTEDYLQGYTGSTISAGKYLVVAYGGTNWDRHMYAGVISGTSYAVYLTTFTSLPSLSELVARDNNSTATIRNNFVYLDNVSGNNARPGLTAYPNWSGYHYLDYANSYSQAIPISSNNTGRIYTFASTGSGMDTLWTIRRSNENANTSGYLSSYYDQHTFIGTRSNSSNYEKFKLFRVDNEYAYIFDSTPYTVTSGKSQIEVGNYIIRSSANTQYVLSPTAEGSTAIKGSAEINYDSATDTVITLPENEYYFDYVTNSDNQYKIKNSSGKYLNITSSGASFSDSEVTLQIAADPSNNNVRISNLGSGYSLTSAADSATYTGNSWYSDSTQQLRIYKDTDTKEIVRHYVTTGATNRLYDTLNSVLATLPSDYDTTLYREMLDYANTCIDALKAGDKTVDEYNAMADELQEMYNNLGVTTKTFSAKLFKYGYDTTQTGSAKYLSTGGFDYNLQSIQTMKEYLIANQSEQLKNQPVSGSTTAWTSGLTDEQITAGLDTIAEAYARLYTLQFNGPGTQGGADGNIVNSDSSNGYGTAWNWWTKKYCFDTELGETYDKDEGASILGLYGLTLGDNGLPRSRYQNDSPLEYKNVSARSSAGLTSNMTLTVQGKTVELKPLTNVSVYIPDLFVAEDTPVDTEKTLTSITRAPSTSGYSKYYWDTDFPFRVITNKSGVKTYVYDSSDTNYIYRAKFNDENHKATSVLQKTNGTWKITNGILDETYGSREEADKHRNGFFPFNYQLSEDEKLGATFEMPTIENAIYHYGMSFGGQFIMPQSGTNFDGTNIVFDFNGDDDVLVYIDGNLILNNGGIHGARSVSINFSEQSVTYQFAFDIEQNKVINVQDNNVNATIAATKNITFKYGETAANEANGITEGIQTGLDFLHSIHGDGLEHNFDFFYLERGSNASNCMISFNLPQSDKLIRESEHTHVIDYAQTITDSFDVSDFQKMINTESNPIFLGVILGNNYEGNEISVTDTEAQIKAKLDYKFVTGQESITIPSEGTRFGTLTFDRNGNSTFTPRTMEFSGVETYYIVMKFIEDNRSYYCVAKSNFIPATTLYYEDSFSAIKYTPEVGSDSAYAWTLVGDEKVNSLKADIVGDRSMRLYGANNEYPVSATYSSGAAHKVTVDKNTYDPLNNKSWPTATFTFAGTGVDVISLTSNKTGSLTVKVVDNSTNQTVKNFFVDTYYGYTYGDLYYDMTAQKIVTASAGSDTLLRLYTTNLKATDYNSLSDDDKANRYVMTSGGNKVYTTDTSVSSEGAKGWVQAPQNKTENAIYQVPVIKVTDLPYGTYTVTVSARYVPNNAHGITSADVYLDAIRIYDPAGAGNLDPNAAATDEQKHISDSYASDNENYAKFTEIKDMLVGAKTLNNGESSEGIIYIDGNDAIDSTMLAEYKKLGPNHELYLDGVDENDKPTNSIAFEIWATAVPEDIQIGAKIAKGSSVTLTVKNDYNESCPKTITTATDMFYSLDSLLKNPIKWKLQKDPNSDAWYYTSGTIVITNTAAKGNILSITNIKWTFGTYGQNGKYRIPISTVAESRSMAFVVSSAIQQQAIRMMSDTEDYLVTEDDVTVENTEITAGESTVINITTPVDVEDIVITDESGNVITPDELDSIITELDGKQVKQWTASIVSSQAGTYTYCIVGEYEGGYTSGDPVVVTVNVKAQEDIGDDTGNNDNTDNDTDNNASGTASKLAGIFAKIRDFFIRLFSLFKNIG